VYGAAFSQRVPPPAHKRRPTPSVHRHTAHGSVAICNTASTGI
jgi:hypothetical protein